MPRLIGIALKSIAIIMTPIAVIGFVVSKRAISGDQYAAVLEIFGNSSRPGAIEIFGADIQTISTILNFFSNWSLPILIATFVLGILGLSFSNDKLKATWHFCLGLFFSFGIWAIFLTRSRQAFEETVGSAISDLAALVIASYLSAVSADLLNLTGFLAMFFGLLALCFWIQLNRRKATSSQANN
jgi:hypothetical protein